MDMGTGKTKVALDTIAFAFEAGKTSLALIVAPKGVIANWHSEIETHLPDRIVREVVLWKPSLTKAKRKELNSLYNSEHKLRFLLMNVEAFSTKKGVDFAEFLADGQVRFVDVKGFKTDMYKLKVKQVKDVYGVTIEEA